MAVFLVRAFTPQQVQASASLEDTTVKEGNVREMIGIDIPGDVSRDNKVDITDLAMVGKAFGSDSEGSNWNPDADLNRDGEIDIVDLAIVGKNFGRNE